MRPTHPFPPAVARRGTRVAQGSLSTLAENARAEATARVADVTAQLDAVLSAADQRRLRGDVELDRSTALASQSLASATDALDHDLWRLFDGERGDRSFDLAAVHERADRALVQAEAALAAVDSALSAIERILGARQAREENRAQAEVRGTLSPSPPAPAPD